MTHKTLQDNLDISTKTADKVSFEENRIIYLT